MNTILSRVAPRIFQGFRRPVAALPLAFLIAVLLGMSPVLASTPPSVAQETPSGGFSSAPGMYPRDPSAPSAPRISDLGTTGLPADLGTPSGGYSSEPGMMPDTMVMPVAATSGGQSDLAATRAATARFHNLHAAEAAGYSVLVADTAGLTCIAEPGMGAMGFHYLDPTLLDGSISATAPELLVYAPGPDGRLRLVALEYLVLKADWDAAHGGPDAAPPSLFGQTFNFTPAGNRFGLPDFYSLHAWIWDPNPSGMFAMWNPRVNCP
jgi:hypothetical protein